MRKALAGQMVLAVAPWFLAGPFFHLHAGSGDHHGEGHGHEAILHVHLPEHSLSGHSEIGDHDEEERPVDVSAVVPLHPVTLAAPFLAAEHVEAGAGALTVCKFPATVFSPQSHDPPLLEAIPPRAPPA